METLEILLLLLIGAALGGISGYWFTKRLNYKGHIIEIKNNLLGIETILLNDKKIVSKFTFLKSHNFEIESDEVIVSMGYKWHLLSVKVKCVINGELFFEN